MWIISTFLKLLFLSFLLSDYIGILMHWPDLVFEDMDVVEALGFWN
jgi:hypothetical protein